ncbi:MULTISPECIES: TrbC/VirB2 family protein [Hydrogenophaga]|uniref:TrbC/VirB2 family protein n=1 Tax=Hydrogenophaga TaxID=47420 RepID=UPI0009A4127C|nr:MULTISPECIES: TrbC/VirB2 family protein [Hydrogenophaga]
MLTTQKFTHRLEYRFAIAVLICLICIFFVPEVLAQQQGGFTAACQNVQTFFGRVVTILRAASVAIVTIAIVFAGYQIAFAHKRLSDVAPVLVGGLLIGGATALASWFATDLGAGSVVGAQATC